MDELRYLITDNLKGLNWINFFRSSKNIIDAATVKERETFLREFKQEIDFGPDGSGVGPGHLFMLVFQEKCSN